ncbi:hypothetical protein Bca4012_062345 [Brassica carinata]
MSLKSLYQQTNTKRRVPILFRVHWVSLSQTLSRETGHRDRNETRASTAKTRVDLVHVDFKNRRTTHLLLTIDSLLWESHLRVGKEFRAGGGV